MTKQKATTSSKPASDVLNYKQQSSGYFINEPTNREQRRLLEKAKRNDGGGK